MAPINAGQPGPSGLSAAFPVVAPETFSLKYFEVGTWQACLPGLLFLFASWALRHLLDVPYHFPIDPLHVQVAHRRMVDPDAVIECDPLVSDLDYLVLADYNRDSGLYNSLVESGAAQLVQIYPGYEIYARFR